MTILLSIDGSLLNFEKFFLSFAFVNVGSERFVVRCEKFESRLGNEFEAKIWKSGKNGTLKQNIFKVKNKNSNLKKHPLNNYKELEV